MKLETEVFLAKVRAAENPSLADEERVLGLLRSSLAVGIAPSAVAQSKSGSLYLTKAAAKLASLGSKLSIVIAVLAPVFGPGDASRSLPAPAPPSVGAMESHASGAGLDHASRDADMGRESAAANSLGRGESPRESLTSGSLLKSHHTSASRAGMNSRPMQSASASPPETRAEPLVSTLRAELELLRDVQADLKRGDGHAALRRLESHVTTDRRLLAERQAARILALCMLGRLSEGQRAAAEFSRQHPGSLHQQAIARACTNPQRIQEP